MAVYMRSHEPLSVYIHWPFCLSICPYCDFNRYLFSHDEASIDQWKAAYEQELLTWHHHTGQRKIESIYFGGGTPSLMEPDVVHAILKKIHELWGGVFIPSPPEITLEMNPTSVETQKLRAFQKCGINRGSLGIQSLRANILTFLGRKHTVTDAQYAIHAAQDIFPRFSFDIIYGHPYHENVQAWYEELEDVLLLAQHHVSLYHLTYEPGTPFHDQMKRGSLRILPEEKRAVLYEETKKRLLQKGFYNYEVSNYGKPGEEGKHNMAYWRYQDYIGIGPGAHGRVTHNLTKYAQENHRLPTTWMQHVTKEGWGIKTHRPLSAKERAEEVMLMGLRLEEGVPLQRICGAHGTLSPAFQRRVQIVQEAGLLDASPHLLRTTASGRMVLSSLLQYLCQDTILEIPQKKKHPVCKKKHDTVSS